MEEEESQRGNWVFQATPERFDLREHLQPGKPDNWLANQYAQDFKTGDIVYFYQSGKQAGIYGWGRIENTPSQAVQAKIQPMAGVFYDVRFNDENYITRDNIMSLPEWSKHQLFTAGVGTNFKVSSEQARVLNRLIREHGYEAPADDGGADAGIIETVNTRRNGTVIEVVRAERPWRLPVDALVLPIPNDMFGFNDAYTPHNVAGQFFNAFIDDLEKSIKSKLGELMFNRLNMAREQNSKNTPVIISLDEEMRNSVLPQAPSARAKIIVTTIDEPDSSTGIDSYVGNMMTPLLKLFTDEHIRRVVIPVMGASLSEADHEKPGPIEVSRLMLRRLLTERNFGGVQSFTITTDSPEVVDAARRQMHIFAHNRAQEIRNDEPSEEDLLGIRNEVEALAETLMMRDVKPPISVGVIGGWGSGKSTVFKLIQQRIKQLRMQEIIRGWAASQEEEKDLPQHVGHVYQIIFNAWTYAKSDLWASLMQRIFCDLNRQLSKEETLAEEKHDPLKGGVAYKELYDEGGKEEHSPLWKMLRQQKEAQIKEVQEIEKRIADLEVKRDAVREKRKTRIMNNLKVQAYETAISVLKNKLKGYAPNSLPQPVMNLLEKKGGLSQGEVEALFRELRSIKSTFKSTQQELSSEHVPKRIFSWSIVLIIPIIIAVSEIADWTTLQQTLSIIASCVPLALSLLRITMDWGRQTNELRNEFHDTVESEQNQWQSLLSERLAKEEDEDEKEVQEVLSSTSLLNDDDIRVKLQELAEAKEGNLAAYERLLKFDEIKAEELKQEAGPAAKYVSLFEYVQARQDEAYYEKQLGLMHQVKMDIDELTDGIVLSINDTEEVKAAKQKQFPRGEARIVLYIDDLDRCPPKRVVEVLEAVQLLLRTKLFIVILGLDTRYVTRALEKEYESILQREGNPSGLDYIEKIIQIPYRVRPVEPHGLGNFLEKQMEFSDEEAETQGEETRGESRTLISEGGGEKEKEPPGVADEEEESKTKPDETPVEQLPPEVIKFDRADLADLKECFSQIIITPRSVKRLVNVLKLMKIFWFRSLGHDRPREIKQAVIALLALSAGYPEIMREAFAQLDIEFRDPGREETKEIYQYLAELEFKGAFGEVYAWQIERFRVIIRALCQLKPPPDERPTRFLNITLDKLESPTFNLIRSFSFVGDPSYAIDAGDARLTNIASISSENPVADEKSK